MKDYSKKNNVAKLIGPRFFEEFPLVPIGKGYDATGWLMFIGILRDELPWLYEIGYDLYRALTSGEEDWIEGARECVLRSVRKAARNDWLRGLIAEDDLELAARLYHLPDLIEGYLSQIEPQNLRAN